MLTLTSTQTQVARTCYDTFSDLGWSHVACCGLLAMAMGESSLLPNVIGDHGTAFGLWQEHGDRVAAIKAATGIDMRSAGPADQARGVDWELRGPEARAGNALKASRTIAEAVTTLVKLFERPADPVSAIAKRTPYAEALNAMFAAPATTEVKPVVTSTAPLAAPASTPGKLTLPRLRFVASPNFSTRTEAIRLIVVHDCEGAYSGAVSWFQQKASQVSAHYVLKEDGTEATQMVADASKAWHAMAFNSCSIGCEMGGYAARGFPEVELDTMARVVAWLLHKHDLPVRWAKGGEGSGFCSHYELGQAGGGHKDPSTDPAWVAAFVAKVEAASKLTMPSAWNIGAPEFAPAKIAPTAPIAAKPPAVPAKPPLVAKAPTTITHAAAVAGGASVVATAAHPALGIMGMLLSLVAAGIGAWMKRKAA